LWRWEPFWLISERISGEISELTKRVSENLQQLESALQQNRRTRQFLQGQGDGGGTLLNGEMWGCVGGMFSTALGAIANGLILLVMRRMLYVEDGLNESPHPRQ
jgi:hypothetical protein